MPAPAWRRYLRFWRASIDADIDDELRFHLGERVEELMAAGMSKSDARRRAVEELGDLAAVSATLRTIDARMQRTRRAREWVDRLARDVRYAIRGCRRAPMFTAAVVITLGVGVGANVAVLSLADRLFVRPPAGVARPDQLRRIYTRSNWSPGDVTEIHAGIGYPQFGAVAAAMGGRARFTAYTAPDSVIVGGPDDRSVAMGSYVDASFFPVLGVPTERGRAFTASEVRFGAMTPVAIISDTYWRRHLGGDDDVIGRQITFDRRRYTIIGVAASGFRGTDLNATDVWLPLSNVNDPFARNPWYLGWRRAPYVRVIARVNGEGMDAGLAAAATAAFRRGELDHEANNPDTATVLLGPILESLGPSIRPKTEVAVLTRLLGVAILLLLVAGANVANLLLARAASRQREIAVRLALGVSRGRLLGQFLIESVTLSLVAGILASAAGLWSGSALAHLVLPQAQLAGATLDWRTIGLTIGVAIGVGVLAGLSPALHARRADVAASLKAGARNRAGSVARARPALVAAQTALSLVLIVGAGLFAKSFRDARGVDVGYDVDRLVFGADFFVDAGTNAIDYFGETHRAETVAGMRLALERIQSAPGVEGAALASHPPLGGYSSLGLYTDAGVVPRVSGREGVAIAATPGYFMTTGVELSRGRLFDATDDAGSPLVAVVSETAARSYWPGRDAVGQCLHLSEATAPCTRVVGITKDSHLGKIVEQPTAETFLPVSQQRGYFGRPAYLVVRASPGRLAGVTSTLRATLRSVFPTAEPPYVKTVASLLEPELRPWRLGAALFGAFGGLALIVAAVGVYSAMSYSVTERFRELGIRRALGAPAAGIIHLVVVDGLRMVGAGVVVGVGFSLAGGRLVAAMLYSTSPYDPVVLAAGAAGLAALGIAASSIPAWRASRVDPMVALRAD